MESDLFITTNNFWEQIINPETVKWSTVVKLAITRYLKFQDLPHNSIFSFHCCGNGKVNIKRHTHICVYLARHSTRTWSLNLLLSFSVASFFCQVRFVLILSFMRHRHSELFSMFWCFCFFKMMVLKNVTYLFVINGISFFLWSRFTDHAYQYASTPKATSTPLGCIHSYYPYPQCLACAAASLTHSLPGAWTGRKLPVLAARAFFRFSHYEKALTENHPAGG